jgi:hypothetical protein
MTATGRHSALGVPAGMVNPAGLAARRSGRDLLVEPAEDAFAPSAVSYWSPERTDVMRCVLKPSQCIRPA